MADETKNITEEQSCKMAIAKLQKRIEKIRNVRADLLTCELFYETGEEIIDAIAEAIATDEATMANFHDRLANMTEDERNELLEV